MLFIIKPYKFRFLFSIREGSCMLFIIKTLQVPLSALHIVRVRGWGFNISKILFMDNSKQADPRTRHQKGSRQAANAVCLACYCRHDSSVAVQHDRQHLYRTRLRRIGNQRTCHNLSSSKSWRSLRCWCWYRSVNMHLCATWTEGLRYSPAHIWQCRYSEPYHRCGVQHRHIAIP